MAQEPEIPVNQEPPVFYVGLCMAGAVSAGAFTAGVMDYLFEALAEWDKRRGQPGVPTHRVQIPVMGGASAGGMTSIMAATALNNILTPVKEPGADLLAEHPENKLYHSWVDLTGVDMFSKMLDISDIVDGKVLSALNSAFIDPIAERVVSVDNTPANWKPLPDFITPGLKLFTTLSNLQGFDYKVYFNGDGTPETDIYTMVVHNDYACFQLTETAIDGHNNGWIPLNLKDGTNKEIAANAAMATGAFPIGLKSRTLDRPSLYVNNNVWLKDYLDTSPLTDVNCHTLNVDGGMINNEPFEKVRDVLTTITGQSGADAQDFDKICATVLMIEPFPTKKSDPISMDQQLMNVAGLTLNAMRSQMRSKPIHFSDAYKENCAGQYLITPSRELRGEDGQADSVLFGELAIACGALDGFSGFINKEFRVHDYFLGRHNCKIFLRDYFTVSGSALENNEIFKQGYADADWAAHKSQSPTDAGYQIIPVFEDANDYTFPNFIFSSGNNWPTLQEGDIDKYHDALKERVKVILPHIISLNKFLSGALNLLDAVFLSGKVTDNIIEVIKSDLRTWNLLPKEEEADG